MALITGNPEYQIQGLREFQRALAQMTEALPTSLRDYNKIAAEEIVRAGRANANRPQEKLAAKSLRSSRSASYVAVLLGDNARYAFALGSEFGALQYKQFQPWRGNQWTGWEPGPGYYLHPAIREVGTRVVEEYWTSIRGLALRAFPD